MRVWTRPRGWAALLAATVALTGCGSTTATEARLPDAGSSGRVAFFLPHPNADRYEAVDLPYFSQRLKELCPGCEIDYYNAGNDQAVQDKQVREALDKGAKVLVVDVVASKAAAQVVTMAQEKRVPVISYDRLILGAKLDYFVSFNAEMVGSQQATALLEAMGDRATDGEVLWVNGPQSDNNAVKFKNGADSVLRNKVKIAAEFTMPGPGYDAKTVDAWIKQTLPMLDARRIVGVYSVDDASADVIGAALTAAGVTQLPPITGQNADIAGMQRILLGKQYMTVYKPVQQEAKQAAELAVALLRGQRPAAPVTVDNGAGQQPAFLLESVPVTKDKIASTVLKDGFVTTGALCAAAYAQACQQAGIGS